VRYEALAGAGRDAVGAASKTTLLQTGGFALAGMVVQTTVILIVGIVTMLIGIRLRGTRVVVTTATWASRMAVRLRPPRRARRHAGAPVIGLATRHLPAAVLGLAVLAGCLLVAETWQAEAMLVLFLLQVVSAVVIIRPDAEWVVSLSFSQLARRYWRFLLVSFVGGSAVLAVAGNADRPRGLRMVRVTQSDGTRFDAFDLGTRDGRTVVLKITGRDHDRHIRVTSHATELATSAVREVDVLRANAAFAKPHRTFWHRLRAALAT
jgi:hypothetical protein